MASGRQSVSPTTDEVYQSPGASQDDGIDHMMARYSGLVERRQGEGAEADQGGGGGGGATRKEGAPESGGGGGSGPPLRGVPAQRGGLPSSHSHSTNHALFPSPRHAVSAPSSHHSTPARDDDGHSATDGRGGGGGGGRGGATGLAGDIRSFSWDNVATGPGPTQGEPSLYCSNNVPQMIMAGLNQAMHL